MLVAIIVLSAVIVVGGISFFVWAEGTGFPPVYGKRFYKSSGCTKPGR